VYQKEEIKLANQNNYDTFLELIKKSDTKSDCPVKYSIEQIGGKWKPRIILQLFKNDTIRFNELKREMKGITNTMLSNSLKELENDQIIERIQYNEMPLRVEYNLKDKGRSLLPLIYELSVWGIEQMKSGD
jgi:DNA-binding HxlR family transcriptional regulator